MSRTFIRIETYDQENHETLGGYRCAVLGELAFARSNLATHRSVSSTEDVKTLTDIYNELREIPEINGLKLPDDLDPEQCVSLLKPATYEDKENVLIELDNYIRKKGREVSLVRKTFEIPEQDIIHEDYYQIVIRKDKYKELNKGVAAYALEED